MPPLTAGEACELFVARAAAEAPDLQLDDRQLDAVDRLCERLDRLPLPIELAAARARTFTPIELEDSLDERFRLLVGGRRARTERHRTMLATLDWSYDLCDERERAVFDALSVFRSPFDARAARAVAAGGAITELDVIDVLPRLVDRSIVQRTLAPDGTSRYRLLETMRAYGQEHLQQMSEADDTRGRHARFITATMTSLHYARYGPDEYQARRRSSELIPECRAALNWLIDHHYWHEALAVARIGASPNARAARELSEALHRAILDAGATPDFFDILDLLVRGGHTRAEEGRRAWEILDRRPSWRADRVDLVPLLYIYLNFDSAGREPDDILATLELVEHLPVATRIGAQFYIMIALLGTADSQAVEDALDRFEPEWLASGSALGRWGPPIIRGWLALDSQRYADACRQFDIALAAEPLEQRDALLLEVADDRLRLRVLAGEPVTANDLIEPWTWREASGGPRMEPYGTLIAAFALDHLGQQDLADAFRRRFVATTPTALRKEYEARLARFEFTTSCHGGPADDITDLVARLRAFALTLPADGRRPHPVASCTSAVSTQGT